MSEAQNGSYRVIRLKPDTKAAESLSRRLWKGGPKLRSAKDVAGRKVYQHDTSKSGV